MVIKSKKLLVGVAALGLAFPAAAGILAVGNVGAQQTPTPPPAQSQPAQTAPANPPATNQAEAAETGTDTETPPVLPAGSVSQDAALQAAVAYVQQTAPYSSQGLTVKAVEVDEHHGTVVYKVTFTNASGQGAEVTVDPQTGKVLKAEADGAGEHQSGAQDAETNDAPGTTAQ